jgi:hypothetical protein
LIISRSQAARLAASPTSVPVSCGVGSRQVGGGDLAQVPERQQPELGVDAGDRPGRPGLAGPRGAGEDQVLPCRPRDRRAGLAAGLLGAQDGD